MNVEKFRQKLTLPRLLFFLSVFMTIYGVSLTCGEEASLEQQGWKPEWMVVDSENKFVSFIIIGGYDGSNGTYNFNGFSEGELTITVPLDWKVEMRYTTRSAYKPHSAGITLPTDPMPQEGGTLAFAGAATNQFIRGIHANNSSTFTFVAKKTGRYWLFCGVSGHGKGGMWDYFVVSDSIDQPSIHIEKKATTE